MFNDTDDMQIAHYPLNYCHIDGYLVAMPLFSPVFWTHILHFLLLVGTLGGIQL